MPPKSGVNKRRPAKSANPAKRVSVASKENADIVTELPNAPHKAKVNHFLGKHIDIDRLREPADFSGVFRITHDIKIGFNKFDMFLDRFESQKRVVRNNNFKLITGKGTTSKSRQIEQKKEDVTEHIKNKRMISHLMQLREIGMALDDVCWGTDFVDEEILDRYVARLREQIEIEKEKTQGVYKPASKDKAKAKSKPNVEVQAVVPQHQLAAQQKQTEAQQEQQTQKQAETANKEDADFFGTTENSALTMSASQAHMKRFETMNEEQMMAYRDQCAERERNRQIADMLMDPQNNLEHLNKEEFSKLLAIENVFDDVANRVFNLHNEHNKKLNEQYPLMIKLETSVQKVKQALYELDQVSFRELRDLKLTPSQIYARSLQKQARIKYSVVDDMREIIGNESLTRDRFCGIIDKLLKQKAKEMGKLKKGYGAYYLDEITNHADELPVDEKCIKSLLSKENTLRHKADEILAKKLLKAARAKSLGAKVSEEEQRRSSPIAADPPYQVPPRVPRVKTLSEIQAEKAAMLKRQQEKLVRDRQLVLDNIYLMRLKEMYPDAQVTCSDHIQNLIDAYMRRNMVQQEIMEELALEKLKKKKPRPHKLIKGLAIVRPNMFEYLDNDPAGLIEKEARQRALAADSSDEEPPLRGKVHESVQTALRGENEDSEDCEEQETNAKQSVVEQRRRSDQRIQVKQLDMTKLQVKEAAGVQASAKRSGEHASSSGGDEIPDMHEKLEYALNTDSKGEEVLASEDHTIQAASGKSLSAHGKNEEAVRDSPTADFTNDGRAITSQQHEKDLISDRTIRESYLASLGPESQGKVDHRRHRRMVNSAGGEIASGEQQIKQPVHSEHHAEGHGQGEVSDGRESPGFQLTLMGNPPLGMFEQKSDDVSRTESKPHASRLGKQGAIRHHRTARHHLEMERLGMRETRFMDRIRLEAEERRGKHQRPATLSSLKKERQVRGAAGRKQRISTLDNRFASSARTIEFQQDKQRARAASPNDQFNPMILSANITRSGGRSPDGNIDGGMVSNQSFINSQVGSAYNVSKSNLRQNQRNSTLHTTINPRTSQQDYAHNACPSDVTWQKDTFETRQPPSSNAVLRSLGINPGAAKQSTKKNFYTKPILSYTMPITADRTTRNSPDEKQVKEMANPLAATQKRFPLREAHTVHIRRRLEANPYLTQKALHESESAGGGVSSNKTGQQDAYSVQRQQKRPVTGKTRDSTTVDRTQVLSKIGTNRPMNKPASVSQMNVLQHLMRPETADQRKVNVGVATESWQKMKLESTQTESQEFCQVHESELPDRILSFMENNDLPVFVDKKKCNTIRYRTTNRHEQLEEFDQVQKPIAKLSIVPDSAFIRPLAQVQTADLLNTQHLSLGMTLVLDPQANRNFQTQGETTLTDLQNMLLAAEGDPRKHIRPVSSKPAFQKIVTQNEPTSPDLDDTALQIEKEKSATSASAAARTQSFRRRVVVQSNNQAESTDKSPMGESRQGKIMAHPRNETPQIINIVGNCNPGQINQDLGNDLIDSNGVKGNEQGSSIGTATERNTTFDNRDTLPRPLYLKSRTQREARHSAKMRAPTHKADKRRQTAKPNSNMGRNSSTSHMGNQVRIHTNQIQQAQRRSKAFTPTVAADTAIEPPTQDDVLSADHPMVGYVANAAYAEPSFTATPQYEDM